MAMKNRNSTKTFWVATSIITAFVIGLLWVGIHRHHHDDDAVVDHHMMQHHDQHGSESRTSLNSSEVMFLQMMIPHHRQAVELAALALSRSNNAELRALAKSIHSGQTQEIAQMKRLLRAAGEALRPTHPMHHAAEGMVSNAEFAQMKMLDGAAFDEFWLKKMTAHHNGALAMVALVLDSHNTDVEALAGQINGEQSAEIREMTAMLSRLPHS